ncbi:sigma-70 family RNA polymerase sigma factor [Leucobacter sp. CSA1]|uniref:Sigma-70 family RNA polymerase sigma factor n=1 Tax=Leucobacter chromiisoli TaxID=2796471 RepID=A0A934Q759_9MICO|nr:sigma-70 family RNA polymerase sigma factor [Leucobacter chromiisoli]MBK0418991.1 sigma-70 family RNA polymerase sigma factor [Leucobacter chromiisoli]
MREPFEQAVQRHGATVLRVCRAVLGAGPDADDAWSETFLAAMRAWPELPETTNVEAWLVRVSRRKAIDITRARARRAIPSDEIPDRPSPLGNPGGDELGLWAAVADLPERQRLAIAYHYLGGLPHAETAAIIGGSAEAVRRAASDGVGALRRRYRADEEQASAEAGRGRAGERIRAEERNGPEERNGAGARARARERRAES